MVRKSAKLSASATSVNSATAWPYRSASKPSPVIARILDSSSSMSRSTRSRFTTVPSSRATSLWIHCQVWEREIAAVAASSIRLKMPPAPVTGLDQELGIGAHERRGHRDRVPLGQHELLAPGAELLDDAEQVVPAARVQPGRVLPQLVEDLLHLERRRDRLDQHGGPDGAAREAERVLGQVERVVPQPRLEVALVLGQVEVRPLALVDLPGRAGLHVQGEVD